MYKMAYCLPFIRLPCQIRLPLTSKSIAITDATVCEHMCKESRIGKVSVVV